MATNARYNLVHQEDYLGNAHENKQEEMKETKRGMKAD